LSTVADPGFAKWQSLSVVWDLEVLSEV